MYASACMVLYLYIDRVYNLKNENMRINPKGMFFDRANLGMQKAVNSLSPQSEFSGYGYVQFYVRNQKRKEYIQQK